MSSWLVLFLAENSEWRGKALKEIKNLVDQYSTKEDGQSLSAQLAQIPPNVWEEQMPVLDACLRETIRIVMTGTALRRVITDVKTDPTMTLFGKPLKKGQFLAYQMAAAHHNPDIYPEPMRCVHGYGRPFNFELIRYLNLAS